MERPDVVADKFLPQALLTAQELKDDPVRQFGFFDAYQDLDYESWMNIRETLCTMPVCDVLDQYGENGILWVMLSNTDIEQRSKLYDALKHLTSFDADLASMARLWEWQKHASSLSSDTYRQYRFMDSIVNRDVLASIDLAHHLGTATRAGVELRDKRIKDYSLIPLRAEKSNAISDGGATTDWYGKISEDIAYRIWLDTPVGFALAYKGLPNALIGFALDVEKNSLLINQMQGVRGLRINPERETHQDDYIVGKLSSRGLAPIDWRKLLVSVCDDIAQQMELDTLSIQPGEKNIWTKQVVFGEKSPHLTTAEAIRLYDLPAERLGFVREEDGYWQRKVTPSYDAERSPSRLQSFVGSVAL